jgi:hypothetical protein
VVRGGHGDAFPKIVKDLSGWLVAVILGGALFGSPVRPTVRRRVVSRSAMSNRLPNLFR